MWPGGHKARLREGGLGASRAGGHWSGSAFFTCQALRASERLRDHGGVQVRPDSRICPNPCVMRGEPRAANTGASSSLSAVCLYSCLVPQLDHP